ncbi:MAG: sulfocyanin-like copper-binding protein [Actinomycetota bacterium]
MSGHRLAPVALALSAIALTACSNSTGGGTTPAEGSDCDQTKNVCVTERDFAIAPIPSKTQAGSVTFQILNTGPSEHEFVVIATDLAPDALPVKEGVVDEAGGGMKVVDEKEEIPSGTETSLTTNLKPGSYALICNLPGHYEQGMHAGFSVA